MISFLVHIYRHPFGGVAGIFRFIKWQLVYRLFPYPFIYNLTDSSKVIMKKGLTGMTLNYYTGLCELNDMGFLLHFLKKGELFVDVGANVGSYSILASTDVGANVISIEPIESTFDILRANILLNEKEFSVELVNSGVGARKDCLSFTTGLDAMNHVITEGDDQATVMIEIEKLDKIVGNRAPKLIKIDTEGFELEVLEGAVGVLQNLELQAIIIELCGIGSRYGYSDEQVHNILVENGFFPVSYDPFKREILQQSSWNRVSNTIYIRNLKDSQLRVLDAGKTRIQNYEL